MDAFDPYEPYTRVFAYDKDDSHLWYFYEEDYVVIDICTWKDPAEGFEIFVTMSNEGEVVISQGDDPIGDKIAGAGVFSEDATGWGYMRSLRQIGKHLYAVGGAGQVYKRLGSNRWEHMDHGVIQTPDVEDRLLLADIH